MKVDTVITLDNDLNVLLVDKTIYEDTSYFLGIVLDENEEPTEESAVLKEIIEEDGTYVEKCEDQTILTEVLKDFTKSLNKFVGTLPEE